jgi:hypothetical protein
MKRDENAETLKRPGSLLTNTNEAETEIKARTIADNKYYRALGRTLQGRYIAQSLKEGLYKTIILRKMFRRTHENGYIQCIRNKCKFPANVPVLKVRR